MQNLKWNKSESHTLQDAAELFRDNIWIMVEAWMHTLTSQEGDNNWKLLPETQLVDNLPTLLRGISKVVENPNRITDFEPEGIIYLAAAELGRNRRAHDFKAHEVLSEQETLRDIIWSFCRTNLSTIDFYELERRINRPLDKMSSIIIDSYISTYAAELKHLARRDKLTGFLNYEAFKEAISEELKRSRRYRHPFSLIMIDVDNFQDYVTNFGHAAGDTLVEKVSRIILDVMRTVDIAARHGLDEFAIILPETPRKNAKRVAERIRRAIKLETRHSSEVRGDIKAPVTISIGVSAYPKDAETVDEIISLADGALFEAKKSGKDMVIWR